MQQRRLPVAIAAGKMKIIETHERAGIQALEDAGCNRGSRPQRNIGRRKTRVMELACRGLHQMGLATARPAPEENLLEWSAVRPGRRAPHRRPDVRQGFTVRPIMEIVERRTIPQPHIECELRAGMRAPAHCCPAGSVPLLARTYRQMTESTAAPGSASSTPMKPNRRPPAMIAKITATGCRPMRPPTR